MILILFINLFERAKIAALKAKDDMGGVASGVDESEAQKIAMRSERRANDIDEGA